MKRKKISKREKEILSLISQGLTAPLIAQKLNLSEHTVKTHRKNMKKKLNVKTLAEMVSLAITKNVA
ncbi:MAG: helix-turn-helix transcriptional regulator [Bacteroidota bacterium]